MVTIATIAAAATVALALAMSVEVNSATVATLAESATVTTPECVKTHTRAVQVRLDAPVPERDTDDSAVLNITQERDDLQRRLTEAEARSERQRETLEQLQKVILTTPA